MMDYPGAGDYDVNTPFKYEEDEPPSDGVEDNRPHTQDDLLYTPLDFAHGDVPSTSTSNSHSNMMDTQPSIDLVTSSSNGTSHILGSNVTTDSVVMETNDAVPMETNAPSSPESDEIPLAARTRTRPSRSTRSKKSFAEVNEEEDEEVFETKPPKGININLYEITTPLVGTQSIFRSDVQKERRANLTKGSKKKKKKEPEFCRFCFTNELTLTKIRSAKLPPSSSHPNTKLTTLVPAVSEVELCLSEKWTNPSFQLVCDDCVLVFSQFYEFRQAVQTNDVLLRRLYCSSKAKSKKLPTTPTSAPVTPTPKGRGRPPKVREISSDDESDAKSTVSTKSNKKKARGKRKGVTDDEETDGYLSSVSKTSRKSTTSRKGGKKKKGGVTSDEETDGYMSSVSKKSTNTGSAAKSKKKRRYNSDSDNEDVKSDVSDGMDYAPTAYAPENDSSSSGEDQGIKQESMPGQHLEHDIRATEDSDIEDNKVGPREEIGIIIKKEANDYEEVNEDDNNTEKVPNKKQIALEKVLKKNLELMTTNVKSKNCQSYVDIICKNLNKPGVENTQDQEAAVKTEDVFDDYVDGFDDYTEDVKPVKKKRGRKQKPDDEKTPKRGRKKKDVKEKKKKIKKEAVSGAEDQSGLDDTDYDPKDFETSAGEDSNSETHDTFFDDNMNFKCRFCDDSFKTNDKLLRHYKAIHSQTLETSSLCPHCGYTTKSKAMLNRHIRRKHMNITKEKVKQVCEICSAEVYHLAVHKRSLHAGLSFPCQYCGKIFPRKGELQFHIKGIHLKHQLEKTYVCEYCHKEFTFYNYLRRHMRVHTNEKPYKCKDCGVGFNHNVSLKNHRNKCPKREIDINTNSNASSTTAASVPRNTVRPAAPTARPIILTAVPTTSTLIAEVAAPPPVSVQDTLNSALARVTGRFDAPIYYY